MVNYLMIKKRSIVMLMVMLLLVTVCFCACITDDVEVYLDWGSYRQTVHVKYGAAVNAKTVPYLDFDFVEGLYDDADFTDEYKNQAVKQSRVLFVKTNTKYPLEKRYFEQIDQKFEESKILVTMNKTFKFDSELQTAVEKQGVKIAAVKQGYDYYEQSGRDDFKRHATITLSTSGDEEVFKAVRVLEQFPQVFMANPYYIREWAVTPNDEYYVSNDLWGLNGTNGISAPLAWSITKGSKNVRIGVIDSGVANHSDLNSNIITGWDFHTNSTNTEDEYMHGTHVAGIIGAVGNNGEGVVGVNWNVTIVPMKVAQNGNDIDFNAVFNAIDWAKYKWGTSEQIDLINYSIDGFGWDDDVLDKIKDYPGLYKQTGVQYPI